MKTLKFISFIAITFLMACSDDDEITSTCFDGIQNGNETGIDCGGSCTACAEPCSNELAFDETGKYGVNLLRTAGSDIDTLQINSFDVLSMQATTAASCTSLRIVITNVTADCENCWFLFNDFSERRIDNWDVSEYNISNNSQTFTSTGTEMDLSIDAFYGGVYEIEYYVNDSLTHTNYLQSNEDELIPFIDGEFMFSSRKGSNLLFTLAIDVSGFDPDSYFGTLDLDDPNAVVENKFIAHTRTLALKDDIIYYWDFVSNEIRSVDILIPNAVANTLLSNVVENLESDGITSMVFDNEMLYFTLYSFQAESGYIGRIDTNEENPSVEVIVDDFSASPDDVIIENQVLYTTAFLSGDLVTVNLADPNYPMTTLPNYFGEGIRTINSIDITEAHIYYTEQGIVGRVSRDTGEREVLVQTNLDDRFYGIHVEGDFILFSEPADFSAPGSQTIYRQDL